MAVPTSLTCRPAPLSPCRLGPVPDTTRQKEQTVLFVVPSYPTLDSCVSTPCPCHLRLPVTEGGWTEETLPARSVFRTAGGGSRFTPSVTSRVPGYSPSHLRRRLRSWTPRVPFLEPHRALPKHLPTKLPPPNALLS